MTEEYNLNNDKSAPESYEISLDDDALDWESALKELESEPSKPAKKAAPAPTHAPVAEKKPEPQAQATPKPVAEIDKYDIKSDPPNPDRMLEEMQEIMVAVNKASNELHKFESAHPYLIAPNIYGVWKDGLKETSLGLMRDFQRLREMNLRRRKNND